MVSGRAYTKKELQELGQELIDVCKEDGVWHLSEFAERKEKPYKWWQDLLRDHRETLQPYHTRASNILGRKMYKESLTGKPMPWTIKTFMPRLLNCRDEVKEETARNSFIKAKAEAQGKLEAIGDDKEAAGAILEYLESQKTKKVEEE